MGYPAVQQTMNTVKVKKKNVLHLKVVEPKKNVPKNYKVGESQEVFPFKDKNDIAKMKDHFLSKNQYRNYLLFVFGINVGLRCGDILNLKWNQILCWNKDNELEFEEYTTIYEQKTGKKRRFSVNPSVQDAVILYTSYKDVNMNEYIFKSQKGGRLEVRSVNKILKTAAKAVGIKFNVGTHSLRKTWGYHQLRAHRNDSVFLAKLQKLFNHSSSEITLRYCGLEDEANKQFYYDVCL